MWSGWIDVCFLWNSGFHTLGQALFRFWKAMRKVYSEPRHQRCWVHKTANIVDKMPKNLQEKAKQKLHEVWKAETRKDANKAVDAFVSAYEDKYPKAVDCLKKDRDELLAFYDFPVAHWQHIRTTNPI